MVCVLACGTISDVDASDRTSQSETASVAPDLVDLIASAEIQSPLSNHPSHLEPLDADLAAEPLKDDFSASSDADLVVAGDESLDVAKGGLASLIDTKRLSGSLQLAISVTLVGFIPALLLLTTSYIRISIVLSLLRQAFGSQQLLPAQVTGALAICCTGLIMWPTWSAVHEAAMVHLEGETVEQADLEQAWQAGVLPIREFMIRQIDQRQNVDDIHLFLQHDVQSSGYPATYDEVPLRALFPAYLVSELKTAFEIGLRIYLPFLVIDLIIAAFTTSLGMFMLPPAMVSLPLKLLLFSMVDGFDLVIGMLIQSFA